MAGSRKEKQLEKLMTSRNVKRQRRKRVRVFAIILCVILCIGIAVGGMNLYITHGTAGRIITIEQAEQGEFDVTLNTGDVGNNAAFRRAAEDVIREREADDAPRLLIFAPQHQLPRAIYLARQLEVVVYGVAVDLQPVGLLQRAREVFVRVWTVAEDIFI